MRNGFYGLQMTALLRPDRGPRRPVAAHLTIDESTAVGVGPGGRPPAAATTWRGIGFWTTGWAVFVLWNLSTLVGAVVGDALGDPRRYGLDAAAAAAFLALLWPRLGSGRTRAVALVAGVVALVLVPIRPGRGPGAGRRRRRPGRGVAVMTAQGADGQHAPAGRRCWPPAACATLLKLAGYLAPAQWLERPRVMRIAGLVTVALLSALVAVQSFAAGQRLSLDARVAALAVAAVLLWRRAPFIVVVVAGALVAAVLRAVTG